MNYEKTETLDLRGIKRMSRWKYLLQHSAVYLLYSQYDKDLLTIDEIQYVHSKYNSEADLASTQSFTQQDLNDVIKKPKSIQEIFKIICQ